LRKKFSKIAKKITKNYAKNSVKIAQKIGQNCAKNSVKIAQKKIGKIAQKFFF